MALDTNIAARIRQRLDDEKEKNTQTNAFKVVSETTGNQLSSSIRSAIGGSSSPAGLIKTVLSGAPKVAGDAISSYLKTEEEFKQTHTLGEQAVRDLVEKPAQIGKFIGVDLPRMILGGLSSAGKTVLEAVYSPVFGKEQTRKMLAGDEQQQKVEKLLFTDTTKSWQQVKEDIDQYTADSPVATDWEKKNLGITLAVAGFVGDIWVGGGGKAKAKIAETTIKELIEATDTSVVKSVLTKAKVPTALADDAAEAIAKATTRDEVEAAIKSSAQNILKQADNAAVSVADDAAAKGSKRIGLVDENAAYTDNMRKLIKEAQDAGDTFPYTKFSAEEKKIFDTAFKKTIDDIPVKVPKNFKPYERTITGDTVDVAKLKDDAYFKQAYESTFARAEGGTDEKLYKTLTKELVPEGREPSTFLAEKYQQIKAKSPLSAPTEVQRATPAQLATRRTKGKGASLAEPARKLSAEERAVVEDINNSVNFKAPSTPAKPTEANMTKYFESRGKIAQMRDSFLEQAQDAMIRMRRLLENDAVKVTDESNWYDKEIAFHGRVGTRLEDAKLTMQEIDKDVLKLAKKEGVDDAKITKEVNEYLIARHAPERNAALEDGAAGITTDAAKARMAELEKLPYANQLKAIAEKIQKLNDETLDILKEGEVITDELYDTLRKKYKNHIPLYRVLEEEDDFAGVLGKGYDVKGSGIKTAKGSQKEVADVLGNVVFNYEQAVIRAEKNRVDLSLMQLITDNKETFGDLFKVRRPKVVGETWSGTPISELVTDPQILTLRVKGKPTLIEIKDPNLAIALRGVGKQKLHGMMRGVAAVTRFYSGVHTRFNPEFAFSNKIRDIQEVLVYTASQQEVGVRGTGKVLAKEARLQNEMAVLDFIRGKDTEGARLYKQMRADGGTTGGMGLSTRKQVELDLTELRKLNRSNKRLAAQKTLEYIDHWNTIFEDSSRLSVYRTAIENGASRQRAAVLAKESSVNFNKFGKQGAIINALYMFSNASIQGTVKTVRAMKNPKVAATVGTAVFGSVYAASQWNDQIDPDWRNKVTTWDRLNNLVIMLPSSDESELQYITIPVAWGIKPIKVMADELSDVASGNSNGLGDAVSSILVSAVEAYNPAGGSDLLSAVTPTILDIPFDVARNKSWNGGAIKPDWDRNAPASIEYFPSLRDSTTGRMAVGLSKGLSGIGIEISPADLDYAYQQLIGGAGRFVNKTVNTLTAIGGGTTPEARDVPVVSRFYKTRTDEEIGAGASEFERIGNVLEEQSREKFYLNQQAEDSLQQLENVPKEEAAKMFEQIKKNDPDLAAEIVKIKKEADKGLTFIDRKILQLGVGNGERAKYLVEKFNSLKSDEERGRLWQEYKDKGIISDNVAKQIKELLKNQ